MTTTTDLRAAVTGLIGLAAAEEEILLSSLPPGEQGSPWQWAALPLIAHNSEFRQQQVIRLDAISSGGTPPAFAEIDHHAQDVYERYRAHDPAEVISSSRRTASALIDGLRAVGDEDLTDPTRHAWLRGRRLWLQIAVRGFWHPAGHLGDYHVARHQAGRAVALHVHALATARYLAAPDPVLGMASYSLACAQARTGAKADAQQALTQAIALNPDLRANARRDPDLDGLDNLEQRKPGG